METFVLLTKCVIIEVTRLSSCKALLRYAIGCPFYIRAAPRPLPLLHWISQTSVDLQCAKMGADSMRFIKSFQAFLADHPGTSYKEKSENLLLGSFYCYLCNKSLKLSIHCVQLWRKIAQIGPCCTSVKTCLFNKKICQQVGFSHATNLSDFVKNEQNVPSVQRCHHLKLPSSGPHQNVIKIKKSY